MANLLNGKMFALCRKIISTVGHSFSYFLLVNELHELNVFKLSIKLSKHRFCLRPFGVFFMESSVLTIKYVLVFS